MAGGMFAALECWGTLHPKVSGVQVVFFRGCGPLNRQMLHMEHPEG